MTDKAQDVMLVVNTTPAMMFSQPTLPDALFAHIEQTIREFTPDLTTDKGRKAIAALAYKVTQTKTAVDAAGKALNEERRKAMDAVNAERRTFWAKLEELQALARKPLDEWEAAEALRLKTIDEMLATIREGAIVTRDETAAVVLERLRTIRDDMTFDPAVFQGMLPAVELEQKRAVETLTTIHASLVQAEADAAELKRLQAAEEERRQADARAEAAKAEEARQAEAAAAAKQREEDAARAAAAEVERKAKADAEAAEAAHQEVLRAAQRRADEAEAAARKAEEDRQAEAKRVADEAAARAADQEHRETVLAEAAAAIMLTVPSMPQAHALRVIRAIVLGEIPHVTLEF